MVINPIVGVYIPIIRIPYDHPQYKEFRPWHISLECLEKHSRTLANLSSYESVYTCFFFSFQLVKKRGPGWTPVIQKSTHETCHSMVFQNIFHRFHRHQLCITNNHYGIRSVSPSHRSVGVLHTPSHRSVRFRGPRPLAGLYLDRHFVWGTKGVVHIQPHLTKKTCWLCMDRSFFGWNGWWGYLHPPKI